MIVGEEVRELTNRRRISPRSRGIENNVLRDRQDSAGVSLTRDAPAKAAFRWSILYLFALFGALALDHALA